MSTPRFVEVPLADWQKVNSELARVREVNAELASALQASNDSCQLFLAFLASLNKGWLGKTTGDIGPLNDAYLKSAKAVPAARAALAKHKATTT